jgi:alpha-tubulin suppressor-like RCC1 family protein
MLGCLAATAGGCQSNYTSPNRDLDVSIDLDSQQPFDMASNAKDAFNLDASSSLDVFMDVPAFDEDSSLQDHLSIAPDVPLMDRGIVVDRTEIAVDVFVMDSPSDSGHDSTNSEVPITDRTLFVNDVSDADRIFTRSTEQVVAGCGLTCAVVGDGSVFCWGQNLTLDNGGSGDDQLRPRQIGGFRNIVQLSLSCRDVCGVDSNHDVWCFGSNPANALQTGSLERYLSSARRRMDVRDMVQVAPYAFLGRHIDGSLYGRNPDPLIRFSLPAPAIDLQAGGGGYCAVLSTGQVVCYVGDAHFSTGPRLVSGLDNVIAVTVGREYYCALKRDGTVWCWGRNEVGQTGTPPEMGDICLGERRPGSDTTYIFTRYYCVNRPRQVTGLTDVVEIRAGYDVTCARKRDQTVWCWGGNTYPIGDGLPDTEVCRSAPWEPVRETPVPRPCRVRPSQIRGLTGVTSIGVDGAHTCALLSSGQIWCWGDGNTGALGDGTRTSRATPFLVPWSAMRRDE